MDTDDKTKDVVPEKGGDSEVQGQKDSTQPKIYTEDEAEKKFSQQRSVLDRKITGLEKQVTSYQGKDTVISELKTRLNQMQDDIEVREREIAKEDPDALKTIEAKQALRRSKAELDARETKVKASEDEHAEALKALVTSKKEQNALEIANRFKVDAESLVKFTDGSPEAMEELAKALPKKQETPPLTPDSGKTTGGGTLPESAKGKMRAGWDELHK